MVRLCIWLGVIGLLFLFVRLAQWTSPAFAFVAFTLFVVVYVYFYDLNIDDPMSRGLLTWLGLVCVHFIAPFFVVFRGQIPLWLAWCEAIGLIWLCSQVAYHTTMGASPQEKTDREKSADESLEEPRIIPKWREDVQRGLSFFLWGIPIFCLGWLVATFLKSGWG
jgi:hypothetical protein